jgi:hypothetical protein
MSKVVVVICLVLLIFPGCIYVPSVPGITAGEPPSIASFGASPDAITAGSRAQLSWAVTGARSVSIDNGVGSVALSGSRTVTPAVTTTYTLTAQNASGSVSATAVVTVSGTGPGTSGAPVIVSFTASPSSISAGGTSVLSWSISNGNSAFIDQGIGQLSSSTGTRPVTPAVTTTYLLTTSNSAGSVTSLVTVFVSGSPGGFGLPIINTFDANPNVVAPGQSTVLSWNISNSSQVTIQSSGGSFAAVEPVGSITATPVASSVYTITASNGNGVASRSISVAVGGGGGVSHTVNLSPVAGETGAVYSDGTVSPGVRFAGDTGTNAGIRCYFSFDISGLAGKNVTGAKLTFPVTSIVRDPFGNLAGLWVAKVDYGVGALQASDFNLVGTPFAGVFSSVPAEVNVTSYVKSAILAGDPRFQTRLHFNMTTNNDSLADYVNFGNAVLTITYND